MNDFKRFLCANSYARPVHGQRVIQAYSLKLGRHVQCFGEQVFGQWIRLEADPTVQEYCERPTFLDLADGKRLVDFWVRQGDREVLLIVDDASETTSAVLGEVEFTVRTIPPAELAAARMWISNWERMLPVITTCRQQISESARHSMLRFIDEPMQLSRIEQEFVTGDPTLVRATVFSLLHRGKLKAPRLQTEELSFLTYFEPARAER